MNLEKTQLAYISHVDEQLIWDAQVLNFKSIIDFRVTRKYLKCQWKGMQKTCGKHAADWQYRTHRAMIQPTMNFADCDLGINLQ